MTFNVEVVLKGRDFAITAPISIAIGAPSTWDDAAVRELLAEILRAIARAEKSDAPSDQPVVLRGFSWIVEPFEGGVVIALEIPMGAAVAGPFSIGQPELDAMISRVMRAESQLVSPQTVH